MRLADVGEAAVRHDDLADRIAVGRATTLFRRQVAAARLDLFRLHLQHHVRSVSPVLLRIAEMGEVDLTAAMWRMRPPIRWPRATGWDGLARDKGTRSRPASGGPRQPQLLRTCGEAVIRGPLHPEGSFAVRPARDAIEMSAHLGKAIIQTSGGVAYLTLDHDLPLSVCSAAVGRPLASLVSHRWLLDPEWCVIGVHLVRSGTLIAAATGQARFAMPWRSMLAAASARVLEDAL